MYITYHRNIIKPTEIKNTIPHIILNKEVQDKLKEVNAVQTEYFFLNNEFYCFLYLNNGNRLDIELK